ncbi:MAG: helix-turn-helix domain-containing protein [Solirubrobacteraceae bacterium]
MRSFAEDLQRERQARSAQGDRVLGEMPTVLTVEQTAAILRTGRSATYAAIHSGQIPSIRVGRSIRVPRARLAELLGESAKAAKAA